MAQEIELFAALRLHPSLGSGSGRKSLLRQAESSPDQTFTRAHAATHRSRPAPRPGWTRPRVALATCMGRVLAAGVVRFAGGAEHGPRPAQKLSPPARVGLSAKQCVDQPSRIV